VQKYATLYITHTENYITVRILMYVYNILFTKLYLKQTKFTSHTE